MSTLTNSRHKIERADKHIADFKSRVVALKNSDVPSTEVNPQTGHEAIKHDLPDVTTAAIELALIIGDAIHNLKCALDFAWLGTLERLNAPTGDWSKLPVFRDRKQMEQVLLNGPIHASNSKICPFLIEQIKPYDGGNDAIRSIHLLDIADKHQLLIPLITYQSINGVEFVDEAGNVERGYSHGTWERPPWYIDAPKGFRVKNHGTLGLSVLFENVPPSNRHLDVDGMLFYYRSTTLHVVEALEGFLKQERVVSQ